MTFIDLNIELSENKSPKMFLLTLVDTGHFASFHGTGRLGVGTTPRAVSPLIGLELRGKNERVGRRETKRLVYKLKVLGRPVTSEVGSSAEKWRKPVISDNFDSDGARAKISTSSVFLATSRTRFNVF